MCVTVRMHTIHHYATSLWNIFIKSLCLVIRQTTQKTEKLHQRECVSLHQYSTAVKSNEPIHYVLTIYCKNLFLNDYMQVMLS